ncbi:MAG: 2-oxo-4-hydroxy-4-carboxy-5-ureidoimidazoline decarboxylase [bacterium]
MKLAHLNHLDPKTAQAEFARCCGSSRWADEMAARRPFRDEAELYAEAQEIWRRLSPEDWREAFSHHPKIGDRDSLRQKFAGTRHWSEGEQAGMHGAAEGVLEALAAGNAAYEEKFGYIFIVCATGKSAEEMLAILRQRLPYDPAVEIKIAAEEQSKITKIRLEKLLQ